MASLDRIDVILDAEITITEKPNAKSLNHFEKEIEYKNLSFKYIEDYVLKNINLKLKKVKNDCSCWSVWVRQIYH